MLRIRLSPDVAGPDLGVSNCTVTFSFHSGACGLGVISTFVCTGLALPQVTSRNGFKPVAAEEKIAESMSGKCSARKQNISSVFGSISTAGAYNTSVISSSSATSVKQSQLKAADNNVMKDRAADT
eukprot:SAG31_NODE_50_length_30520_cov_89.906712_26_plen_126_part_00